LARTTYNDVRGDVFKDATCGRDEKRKKETFMRQTCYLPRPPTSTSAPEILHVGWVASGKWYIFQVSWKSTEGFRSCEGRGEGGRKSPSPIDLAHCLFSTL